MSQQHPFIVLLVATALHLASDGGHMMAVQTSEPPNRAGSGDLPPSIFTDGYELTSITMRSDSIRKYDHLDYLYAWDGYRVAMYGDRPRLVQQRDNRRVAPSHFTLSGGVAGDTFGFRMSGVADWNSQDAINALNIGDFEFYVASRMSAFDGIRIDRHADFDGIDGLKLGFGVDSSAIQVDSGDSVNRTDRVSQPGEALILVVDTNGTLQPDPNLPANTHYEFVPNDATFINSGLHSQTALLLSDLHLEPVRVNPANITCSVDYFIFDVSEQEVITGQSGEPGWAIGVLLASLDRIGTIPGSWVVEDGDIIVLAYNEDTEVFNQSGGTYKHSWSLWSLKWDLLRRDSTQ